MRNSNANLINRPGYSCQKTDIFENKLVFHIKVKAKFSNGSNCSTKSSTIYENKDWGRAYRFHKT